MTVDAGTTSRDHLGDVADLDVVLVPTDVEGLVVHHLARCLEHGEERAADVLDVHERPPRRAVALPGGPRRCVTALPVRLLTTMSSRRRGDAPYAVALRR